MATEIHTRDADCTLGPDLCCIGCGVDGTPNEPCQDCGGRGFHAADHEGPGPCGWTGEKQLPAKRQAPVDLVADSIARRLGYENGSSPAYIADCEREKNATSSRLP
jgi:hypothetical protein